MPRPFVRPLFVLLLFTAGCSVVYHKLDDPTGLPEANVKPGITVLLNDSIALVAGKRVGLLTNASGIDEHGRSDVKLLMTDKRATRSNVHLVELFSPEHGFATALDRTGIASGIDSASGLVVVSLYTN